MCSCVEIENDIINVSAHQAMRLPQIPHMAGMLTWQSGWPPTWRQRGEDHGSGKLSASGVSPVPAERWKQKSQWERFECFTLISMILIVRQLMRRALSPWTAWSWSWGSSRGGWQRSWRPPSPPPSPHTKLPPTGLWHHYKGVKQSNTLIQQVWILISLITWSGDQSVDIVAPSSSALFWSRLPAGEGAAALCLVSTRLLWTRAATSAITTSLSSLYNFLLLHELLTLLFPFWIKYTIFAFLPWSQWDLRFSKNTSFS